MKAHLDKKIFSTVKLGNYILKNRIGMAALTRCRANPKTGIPNELHEKYYTERAEGAGFILTECSSVSKIGNSFPGACGIWTDEQAEGWKKVTDSVHNVNGRIYLQIWHGGRASRKVVIGTDPVAPSSIPIRNPKKSGEGYTNSDIPVELSEEGILEILKQFRRGAENALKAGFDGLELHGANGYLIDQFLKDATNKRTDKYGGSIENRCRFPLMVMDELCSVFGPDKVGIKITPVGRFQDMFDSNPAELNNYFLKELNRRKISFVEIVSAPEFMPVANFYGIEGENQIPDIYKTFRPVFDGIMIANNNLDFEKANKLIEEGLIDMVTFGRNFLANPDLVERYKNGWPLNQQRPKLYYVPGSEGYIDYPKYEANPKF
jgi:N-ethylmaleimide reductase